MGYSRRGDRCSRRRIARIVVASVAAIVLIAFVYEQHDPNCIPEKAHLCRRWTLNAPDDCAVDQLSSPGDASESCENRTLRHAFSEFARRPNSDEVVPVYATACVYGVDCHWMAAQLRSLTFPIGHLYVAVGRDMNRSLTSKLEASANLFPGKMTVIERGTPVGFGCSEWWNAALRDAFAAQPAPKFVMIVNGDVWWRKHDGVFPKVHALAGDHALVLLQWFSAYALTKRAWQTLGEFDENIWPAYGEDDEYQIRMKAAGEKLIEIPQPKDVLVHGGAMTHGDPSFKERAQRWNKNDYIFRKWGIDLRQVWDVNDHHYKLPRFTPFAHPFNLTELSVRDWVLDPGHRSCIRTGVGVRMTVPQSIKKCFQSECEACYFNATVLKTKLAEGTVLPDQLTTTRRIAV